MTLRRLLVATTLLLGAAACTGSDEQPLPGDVEVRDDSRAEAQDLLDAATEEFMTTLTGSFRVEVEQGLPAEVEGSFDAALPAYSSTVTLLPGREEERVLRTVAIGDQVYTHVSAGEPTCWIRLDPEDLEAAGVTDVRAVSVHPATSLLLAPEAVGIVSEDDGTTEVRLDVLWSDAATMVAATAVNQMTEPVPSDARVPAVAEVRDGRVRSVTFSWGDVVDVAEAEGEGYLEGLGLSEQGVADLRQGTVRVTYSALGEPVAVSPPDPASVVHVDGVADGTSTVCAAPE